MGWGDTLPVLSIPKSLHFYHYPRIIKLPVTNKQDTGHWIYAGQENAPIAEKINLPGAEYDSLNSTTLSNWIENVPKVTVRKGGSK